MPHNATLDALLLHSTKKPTLTSTHTWQTQLRTSPRRVTKSSTTSTHIPGPYHTQWACANHLVKYYTCMSLLSVHEKKNIISYEY